MITLNLTFDLECQQIGAKAIDTLSSQTYFKMPANKDKSYW